MSTTRVLLTVFLALVAAAELLRPTHVVVPKRNAASGLLKPARGFDPLLLADLPRMRPNARGNIVIDRARGRSVTISGHIAEPLRGGRGAGVFAIADGRRLAAERASYGSGTSGVFRITLTEVPDVRASHFAVGLIRIDEAGYYLLEDPPLP